MFDEDGVANSVIHNRLLVVVLGGKIGNLVDLICSAHDSDRNHRFKEEFAGGTFPLALGGFENGKTAADFADLGIPLMMVSKGDFLIVLGGGD